MLTTVHYVALAIVFILSFLLGLLTRVLYYSNIDPSQYLRRIRNVILLMLVFPIIAYLDITKHKSEYIAKINKDTRLTEVQKTKLKRKMVSNGRIAVTVVFNSIVRFKSVLDLYIQLLNRIKLNKGEEGKVKITFSLENNTFKDNKEDREFMKNNVLGMFAH